MFIPYMWHNESEPWEKAPATTGANYVVGQALVLTAGKLATAAGAVKPKFICMEDVTGAAADQMIHVEPVRGETIYETELSVQSASIAIGAAYTIDSTGKMITATGSGVAEVVSFDGTAAGSKVRVKFVDAPAVDEPAVDEPD